MDPVIDSLADLVTKLNAADGEKVTDSSTPDFDHLHNHPVLVHII